jgi:hypothetical protein
MSFYFSAINPQLTGWQTNPVEDVQKQEFLDMIYNGTSDFPIRFLRPAGNQVQGTVGNYGSGSETCSQNCG